MDTHSQPAAGHPRTDGRTVALAEAVTLLAFVGYVALPGVARGAGVAVMVVGGLAAITSAAVWLRSGSASRPLALLAVASTSGLLGSVAYLHSIADEPAAIPIVGVGVLLLSLAGLVASALLLRHR